MWDKLTRRQWREVSAYSELQNPRSPTGHADSFTTDAALVNAKQVLGWDEPRHQSLNDLHRLISAQSKEQLELCEDKDIHAYRTLGPKRGVVEAFVRQKLPTTKIGKVLLVSDIRLESHR